MIAGRRSKHKQLQEDLERTNPEEVSRGDLLELERCGSQTPGLPRTRFFPTACNANEINGIGQETRALP